MHSATPEILHTTRMLADIGIDPSSEMGARLTACRLRLYWLGRGYDIPTVVRLTVKPDINGTKSRRDPCYGAQLCNGSARKVRHEEVALLRKAIEDEVDAILTSRLNIRANQKLAAA